MANFRIYVSDRVIYERSCVVEIEAQDEDAACEAALEKARAGAFNGRWEECEVDNTPYDAVLADPA